MTLWRQFMREIGLEGESPRVLIDALLGAGTAFACVILLVYAADHQKSRELTHAAVGSLSFIIVALSLAKHRAAILLIATGFIGIRGLISALLYGYWPGLILAAVAIVVMIAIRRLSAGADR